MKKVVLKSAALVFTVTLLGSPAWASDTARGRELAGSLGCKGCHKIEGAGGSIGPALDGVGKRMKEDQLRKKLVDPKAINPKSTMPAYKHLPPADIEALTEYLEHL